MTISRLLLMALPPQLVVATLKRELDHCGVMALLGATLLFPVTNWHQSLSCRFEDTAENLRRFLRAGAAVSAHSFRMVYNRVDGGGMENGPLHWAIHARGRPKGFIELLSKIERAKDVEGLTGSVRHSAHITISYRAPTHLRSVSIAPVEWKVDEFALVRGGGEPYRYEVIERWSLLPSPADQQLMLL